MWSAALFLLLVTYGSTQNPSDTAAGNGAAGQLEQIITLPPADGSAKASVAAEAGSAGGDAVGECAASLQTFIECAKAEVGEREQAEAKEAAGALHSKIAPCFTKQGCTAPDFTAPIDADLSAAGKQDWQNLSSWWSATDTDRRYCVIAEIRGNFRLKLQDCIARSIPGFVIAPSRDENRLSADEKAAVTKVAEHRFRLHIALRKCGPKEKEVQECLRTERNEGIFGEACSTRKKCAANVSPACQKIWTERIRATVCGCVTETAENLKKNIVTDANGQPLKDDQIKAKCGVDLPFVNVPEIRADFELHTRIKDYVALHEDRRISICHECEGVPL